MTSHIRKEYGSSDMHAHVHTQIDQRFDQPKVGALLANENPIKVCVRQSSFLRQDSFKVSSGSCGEAAFTRQRGPEESKAHLPRVGEKLAHIEHVEVLVPILVLHPKLTASLMRLMLQKRLYFRVIRPLRPIIGPLPCPLSLAPEVLQLDEALACYGLSYFEQTVQASSSEPTREVLGIFWIVVRLQQGKQ